MFPLAVLSALLPLAAVGSTFGGTFNGVGIPRQSGHPAPAPPLKSASKTNITAQLIMGGINLDSRAKLTQSGPKESVPEAVYTGSKIRMSTKMRMGVTPRTTNSTKAMSGSCTGGYCSSIPDGCYTGSGCGQGSGSCSWTYTVSGGGTGLTVTLDVTTNYGSCSHTWDDTVSYSEDGYVNDLPSSWGITVYSDGTCDPEEGSTEDGVGFDVNDDGSLNVGGLEWDKGSCSAPDPGSTLPDGCFSSGDLSCQDSQGNEATCTQSLTVSGQGASLKVSLQLKYDSGDHCTFNLESSLSYPSTGEVTETPDGDPTIASGSSSDCVVSSAQASTYAFSVDESGGFALTPSGTSTSVAYSSTSCINVMLIVEIVGGVVGALVLLLAMYCCLCKKNSRTDDQVDNHHARAPFLNTVVPHQPSNTSQTHPSMAQTVPPVTYVSVQPARAGNAPPGPVAIPVATPSPGIPAPNAGIDQYPGEPIIKKLRAAEAAAVKARNYEEASRLASHWQAIEDLAARVGALVEKEREMVAARDYSAAGICVQEIKDAEAELKQKVTEAEALLG